MCYRVFERKTWCIELLVWLGFWILGLLIKLGVVLNSGILCLIYHLKLFCTHIASTASDKSFKFKDCFCTVFPKFWLFILLIQRLYDSIYPGNNSWLDTIKICLVSLWLCKFFLHFWKLNFYLFHQFFS